MNPIEKLKGNIAREVLIFQEETGIRVDSINLCWLDISDLSAVKYKYDGAVFSFMESKEQ